MIRIVILEDLPIVLEGIRLLLNQVPDFTVVAEFTNGKDFIQDFRNLQADIIITDIDMPIMNGIETTKIAVGLQADIKIIALSMYSDFTYYTEMIAAGAKGFVLKQSSMNELETAIREVVNGGNFFSNDLLQNIGNAVVDNQQRVQSRNDINAKEQEFLKLICQGLSNKELAETLLVSIKTVESNKSKLMEKTGAKNNASLIIWALKNKIIKY